MRNSRRRDNIERVRRDEEEAKEREEQEEGKMLLAVSRILSYYRFLHTIFLIRTSTGLRSSNRSAPTASRNIYGILLEETAGSLKG